MLTRSVTNTQLNAFTVTQTPHTPSDSTLVRNGRLINKYSITELLNSVKASTSTAHLTNAPLVLIFAQGEVNRTKLQTRHLLELIVTFNSKIGKCCKLSLAWKFVLCYRPNSLAVTLKFSWLSRDTRTILHPHQQIHFTLSFEYCKLFFSQAAPTRTRH